MNLEIIINVGLHKITSRMIHSLQNFCIKIVNHAKNYLFFSFKKTQVTQKGNYWKLHKLTTKEEKIKLKYFSY